ncbi:class I SAM-dependent methyltransferase (plasmid) [Rhizobium sp. CB3060]|uniref:class I SAM-dependent methyltransferase n=1 Tax=Rhizobium sp. CB3060 TaxID=3138255 RepID=UPI0021A2E422|nr:class I SAM-dependent methyltransferase [Rhizobium tropici]UWU23536.1 class I SAM-dependent methyltransferase [Rhizobium tropici]
MISDAAKDILGVPCYHQDQYNVFSMINYWCIFEKLIDILQIKSICEIGSDRGDTSLRLISGSEAGNFSVHIVDPTAKAELDELASENIHIHRETSLQFLAKRLPCDLYLVDGDHNYWTLSREIASILDRETADLPLAIAFHDTSWPCARRDSFYALGDVPSKRPLRFNSGISLNNEELNNGTSFPCGDVFAWAEEHGGAENGVLTAIEDSMLSGEQSWLQLSMPSFYGLSIFVNKAKQQAKQLESIEKIKEAIDFLKPLLSLHEANRLRLLQGLHETQKHRDSLIKSITAATT